MKSSSYRVNSRAVVQRRGTALTELPVGHFVALLTKAPKPEGGPLDEIEAPEYVRQPVRWQSASAAVLVSQTIRSANRIVFAPATAWPDATHVAIVDAGGEVIGYGPLATAPGRAGHDEVTFEATAIQLSFG